MDINSYHSFFIQNATDCLKIMKDNFAVFSANQQTETNKEPLNELHRMAHTLKSQFAFMGYTNTAKYCAALEKIYLDLKQENHALDLRQLDALSSSLTILTSALADINQVRKEPDLTGQQSLLNQLFLAI